MRFRLAVAAGAFVMGVVLLLTACGSSSSSSSTHTSSTTTTSSSQRTGFQAGPDPCRLVTSQVIVTGLNEQMAQVKRSKASCDYMNAAGTAGVSISTAKTTSAGAEAAVSSTARTTKAKVTHVSGVGNSAIAYLVTTKTLSIATCLFAKNGTLVFLNVSSPNANHLEPAAIALAKAAASHIS